MNFLLILTSVLVFSAFFIFMKLFANFQPSSKRVKLDLEKMKLQVKPYVSELVNLEGEELELFSMSQVKQLLKKRFVTTAKGVFTSIYDEPLAAYSYKKYISPGKNAILYVRTAKHEFVYRIKNKGTELMIDNQLVGIIDEKGALYGARSKKLLASIDKGQKELLPVFIKDKEVGNLIKALPPKSKKGLSLRAFEFVKEDLNDQEETLFLSLTVLELVKRTID